MAFCSLIRIFAIRYTTSKMMNERNATHNALNIRGLKNLPLTLIKTFEYYDVPQILVAADATGTNYLCTLFKNDAESGYHYLAVQISEARLASFTDGQLDLREAYTHPESEKALYLVTACQGLLNLSTLIKTRDVTEEMLPEAGYTFP